MDGQPPGQDPSTSLTTDKEESNGTGGYDHAHAVLLECRESCGESRKMLCKWGRGRLTRCAKGVERSREEVRQEWYWGLRVPGLWLWLRFMLCSVPSSILKSSPSRALRSASSNFSAIAFCAFCSKWSQSDASETIDLNGIAYLYWKAMLQTTRRLWTRRLAHEQLAQWPLADLMVEGSTLRLQKIPKEDQVIRWIWRPVFRTNLLIRGSWCAEYAGWRLRGCVAHVI